MTENKIEKENISQLPVPTKDPGFWRELWQRMQLVYYLIRDPEVPLLIKLLPLAAVVYLVIPIDFVPDWLVGLDQIDDVTVVFLSTKIFIHLAPTQVVARHMKTIRQKDGYTAFNDEPKDDNEVVSKPRKKSLSEKR